MGLTRSRTLQLILLLGLVVLSLRPVGKVDQALEHLFLPARALAVLAAPFGWVRTSEVRAAEASIEENARAEREASRALLLDEQALARPAALELAHGCSLIPVRFVERFEKDADAILVSVPAGAELEVGWPVVSSDVYVGRVRATWREQAGGRPGLEHGEAVVDLVTGRSFRIGARIAAAPASGAAASVEAVPVDLVVGGLVESPADDPFGLFLAAHAPSDRSVAAGRVRVHDPPASGDAVVNARADGFLLGDLARYDVRGVPVVGVRAAIDYGAGLHQMFVLGPSAPSAPPAQTEPTATLLAPEPTATLLASDPFDPMAWIRAKLVPARDPSFWRAGRKLALGREHGVEDGAAVAVGPRWIGRVLHAGRWSAEVGLAGDPGLVIHALARIEGDPHPAVLGELVALDCLGGGTSLWRWEAVVPIGATGSASGADAFAATLYTSSVSRSVPSGLVIGTTMLPRGRGSFVLRVESPAISAAVDRVSVWRGATAAHGSRVP